MYVSVYITFHTPINVLQQAYLFKAALSELRTELTLLTRNESAAMRTASTALRKEVDVVDGRMKEDISNLKHECVVGLSTFKDTSNCHTESRWSWTVERMRQRMT